MKGFCSPIRVDLGVVLLILRSHNDSANLPKGTTANTISEQASGARPKRPH